MRFEFQSRPTRGTPEFSMHLCRLTQWLRNKSSISLVKEEQSADRGRARRRMSIVSIFFSGCALSRWCFDPFLIKSRSLAGRFALRLRRSTRTRRSSEMGKACKRRFRFYFWFSRWKAFFAGRKSGVARYRGRRRRRLRSMLAKIIKLHSRPYVASCLRHNCTIRNHPSMRRA